MTNLKKLLLIATLGFSIINTGFAQLNETETSLGLLNDSNDISPFENPEIAAVRSEFKKSELATYQKQIFNEINKLNKELLKLDRDLVASKEDLKLEKDSEDSSKEDIAILRYELDEIETNYSEGSKKLKSLYKLSNKIEDNRENMDKWNALSDEAEALLFRDATKPNGVVDNSIYHFEQNEYIDNEKDCNIIFDGFDEDIEKYRKETDMSFFFSYTHPKLKPHFKDRNFIECKGSVAKIKGTYYLQLNLKLASKDASRNYGQIERNSLIRLQFINGEKHYLSNIYPDAGTIEKYTGNTIYKAVFPIDKDFVKLFKSTELDHIGIIWTTGYEQYEIYEVDFLMQHLNCLERD